MTPARLSCLFLFLLLSIPAWAGKSETQARVMPLQASMVLTGSIVVAPDGSVAEYHLDNASRIQHTAKAAMARTVPTWKFKPVRVNGKAVRAKAAMRVRLVAKQVDKDRFSVAIESVRFPNPEATDDTKTLHSITRKPPEYPPEAIKDRVQGTVYLVMRINRQGKIDKLAARQVDLRTNGTHADMDRWRRRLVRACKQASRHWTFAPPTTGPESKKSHWIAAMPVTFNLLPTGMSAKKYRANLYGKWRAYVPGPRHPILWLADTDKRLIANIDALPDGSISSANQSLHLLTPPSSSGGS